MTQHPQKVSLLLHPTGLLVPTLLLILSLLPLSLQCITDAMRARGINVSTSLPDDVLDFVRRHPLMSQQVQPTDRRPLLFRRTTDYTHMAVGVIQGLDGQTYHVLYMGTGVYEWISGSNCGTAFNNGTFVVRHFPRLSDSLPWAINIKSKEEEMKQPFLFTSFMWLYHR